MNPLVSILIPAFNAESFLAEAITSALQQTWASKEIIIVDDGSSDRTLSIARRFEPLVQVVSQPNQGASAARNAAFSLCKGDYIQWLDADDLLAPDKIARQLHAISPGENKRTLFSSAWGFFFYRPHKATFTSTPLWCDLPAVEWLIRKLQHNLFMSNATWLVSRELTEAAGPWDVRLWKDNDGEYFCRVLLASSGIRFIPEAKAYYRRPDFRNVSYVGRSSRKLESLFLSIRLHIQYLRPLEESERVREACLEFLQRSIIYFYPERDDLVSQLDKLACELGRRLEIPRLPWKYAWIQKAFGWNSAKRAQLLLPEVKLLLIKYWDEFLFCLERRHCTGSGVEVRDVLADRPLL